MGGAVVDIAAAKFIVELDGHWFLSTFWIVAVRPQCLEGPYTLILPPTEKGPVDGDIVASAMFFVIIAAGREMRVRMYASAPHLPMRTRAGQTNDRGIFSVVRDREGRLCFILDADLARAVVGGDTGRISFPE